MDIKYPDIEVQLTGGDGNAFMIMGKVRNALRKAGVEQKEITAFMEDACSGDYDHLLGVCMQWVNVA